MLLLVSDLGLELGVTQDEGYECLMQLSPAEVQARLREVLLKYGAKEQALKHQELIQVERSGDELVYTLDAGSPRRARGRLVALAAARGHPEPGAPWVLRRRVATHDPLPRNHHR